MLLLQPNRRKRKEGNDKIYFTINLFLNTLAIFNLHLLLFTKVDFSFGSQDE